MIGQFGLSRVVGVILSASIHLALGWALIASIDLGVPETGHSDGVDDGVLVVELLPLEPTNISRNSAEARFTLREDRSVEAIESPPKRESDIARLRSAAIGTRTLPAFDGAGVGIAAQPNAPDMADLPDADVAAYRARLQTHLAQFRLYPASAQAAGAQGVVSLHFIMDREGRVTDAWIEKSSGVTVIDREALDAVLRAQPLPPMPSGWPEKLDISLPVRFKLG